MAREPAYLELARRGELARRVQAARALLSPCHLCPRQCGVDRLAGETGFCRTGEEALVASATPHFGEEDPLVGEGGSGTIFFAGCNLGCVFCQNWEISHQLAGRPVSAERLAQVMLALQEQGCHNINLVTPSHVVPQILAALQVAAAGGLTLPLVYNSSGYDRVETLHLLDGVVDIYMPDLKFADPDLARTYCLAGDYPQTARAAIREMHRQVGDLEVDENGIARRGLLVRHLVMPGCVEDSRAVLAFLAELSPNTYVNVMDQYHPCGEASRYPAIARPLAHEEYEAALAAARAVGLSRLDQRNWLRFFRRLGR